MMGLKDRLNLDFEPFQEHVSICGASGPLV